MDNSFPPIQHHRHISNERKLPAKDSDIVEVASFRQIWNKDSSVLARILWLISCSTLLCVCLYQIGERIDHFLKDESAVNAFYVSNKTFLLPSIVFCPYFSRRSVPDLLTAALNQSQFSLNSENDVDNLLQTGKISVYDYMNLTKLLWSKFEVAFYDPPTSKWRNYDSFQLTEMYSAGGLCYNVEFTKPFLNYGAASSIQFIWHDGKVEPSYFIMIAHAKDNHLWQYGSYPEDSYSSHWIYFTARLEDMGVWEIIFKKQIKRRKTKHNHCEEEKYISQCMASCLGKQISPSVSHICRLPILEALSKSPPCKSIQEITNAAAVIKRAAYLIRPDGCNCSQPCSELIFSILGDMAGLPTAGGQLTRSEYMVLNDHTVLMIQDEIGYSWLNLLCDLGGTLGLWLGICGFDILQIMLLSVRSVHFHFKIILHKKQINIVRRRLYAVVVRSPITKTDSSNEVVLPTGLQQVKTGNTLVVKVLWFTLFTAALCLGIYQTVERVSHYLTYPSASAVYYIFKENLSRPSITICPEPSNGLLPAVNPLLVRKLFKKEMSFSAVLESAKEGKSKTDDIWNVSGIPYKVTSFNYDSKPHHDFKITEFYSVLGTCTTVTAKSNTARVLKEKLCFFGEDGSMREYRMILHDPDDILVLKYQALYRGLRVPRISSSEEIRLETAELNYLNSPSKPCSTRQVVNQCVANCIEVLISSLAKKKCRLPYQKHLATVEVCTSKPDIEMMINSTLIALKLFNVEKCNCPIYCKDYIYTRILGYPYPYYEQENTFCVRLRYSQDRIQVLEERSVYNTFSLFCDLGGVVGLFLGLCGLQLVKMIIPIAGKISTHFRKNKKVLPTHHHFTRRIVIVRDEAKKVHPSISEVEVPGFNEVLKKDSATWVRLFWLVASILFLGVSIYQCTEQIIYYIHDPTEVVEIQRCNKSLYYPLLTICPFADDFRHGAKQLLQGNQGQDFVTIRDIWNVSRPKIYLTDLLVNNAPLNLTTSDVNTPLGTCIILRLSEPVQVTNTKAINATFSEENKPHLSISFLYQVDDYFRIQYGVSSLIARLSIHQKEIKTLLRLKVTEIAYRNTHENPCTDGETVAKCYIDCIEKKIYSITNSSCRMPFMQASAIRSCTSFEDWKKIMTKIRFLETLPIDVPKNCNCPRKCLLLWYSLAKLPNGDFYHMHTGKYELTMDIPNNCITVIQEKAAYVLFKLLSDLGGIFGLYFGVGMLQIMEITVFMLKNYFIHVSKYFIRMTLPR